MEDIVEKVVRKLNMNQNFANNSLDGLAGLQQRFRETERPLHCFDINDSIGNGMPIIIYPSEGKPQHAIATLDTACDGDWISLNLVQKLQMEPCLVNIEDPDAYIAFNGQPLSAIAQIELVWSQGSSAKSTQTLLVSDTMPIDLVFGKHFVDKSSTYCRDLVWGSFVKIR